MWSHGQKKDKSAVDSGDSSDGLRAISVGYAIKQLDKDLLINRRELHIHFLHDGKMNPSNSSNKIFHVKINATEKAVQAIHYLGTVKNRCLAVRSLYAKELTFLKRLSANTQFTSSYTLIGRHRLYYSEGPMAQDSWHICLEICSVVWNNGELKSLVEMEYTLQCGMNTREFSACI